jgi:hypothetical protein
MLSRGALEPAGAAVHCDDAMPATPADEMPMTAEQAARLRQLAYDAYELDAFKVNLTQAEAQRRIAMLTS